MAKFSWTSIRGLSMALLFIGGIERAAIAADEEPLPEEEEPIPVWDISANLRGGAGYKSNVVLSDLNPESSVFTGTDLDLFLFRAPVNDPWEVAWLIAGEDRRFWQSETVEKEQMFLTSIDVKREVGERWKAGLSALYLYYDQVFDASVSEGIPLRVQAKFHKFNLGPTASLQLENRRRFEFRTLAVRNVFEAPLDDSWQGEAKALFGQGFGEKSEYTVSLESRYRQYDNRRHPTIPATSTVEYWQHEVETGVRHNWDDEGRWKSRARVAFEYNDDNGNGHYNYRKYRAAHALTFALGKFEAILDTKFLYYDYSRETFETGERLNRTELIASLRAERSLTKKLKAFAEIQQEWSLSNDRFERFDATTVWAGLDWQIR